MFFPFCPLSLSPKKSNNCTRSSPKRPSPVGCPRPDAKTLEASLDAASAASARCSGVMKASFSPAYIGGEEQKNMLENDSGNDSYNDSYNDSDNDSDSDIDNDNDNDNDNDGGNDSDSDRHGMMIFDLCWHLAGRLGRHLQGLCGVPALVDGVKQRRHGDMVRIWTIPQLCIQYIHICLFNVYTNHHENSEASDDPPVATNKNQ